MGIKTELQNILETVNTYLDPELETQNDLIEQLKLAVGLIKTIITFYVDGDEYQAEKGMTWGEWLESDYNTDGFYIGNTDEATAVILHPSGNHIGMDVFGVVAPISSSFVI